MLKEADKHLLDLLADLFEQDTVFSSRVECGHRYYKAIVAWGKQRPDDIIPWLLTRVEGSFNWCIALWDVVEKDSPAISEEMQGRVDLIKEAWLDWGKAKGYS